MDSDQKNWYGYSKRHPLFEIAFIFICIFLLVHFSGPLVINNAQNDMFTVTGTGEAKGTPTKASFSLTVTAKDSTQKAASGALNTRMKQVIDVLKQQEIAAADIKTSSLQSYPEYGISPVPLREGAISGSPASFPPLPSVAGSGKVSLWTATESIDVKANSVDAAQKALAAAELVGADPAVNGVQFTLDEAAQKQLEQKARVAAINNAKSKANELAKESGITLGRLVNITEDGSPVYQAMDQKSTTAGNLPAEPQLNPGQNTVTKSVTLYYQTR